MAWDPALPVIRAWLRDSPLALSEVTLDRLSRFGSLLLEANQQVNLVSRASADELETRHLLDSLALLPFLDEAIPGPVIDLGAGAGLPGIALAIARPERHLVLVESIAKKTAFATDAVRELGLENVTVVTLRAEALPRQPGYVGRSAVVVARGLARLDQLVLLGGPLLLPGGSCLFPKGEDVVAEVQEATENARAAGLDPGEVHALRLPGLAPRTVVIYRNIAEPRLTARTAPVTRRRRQRTPREAPAGRDGSAGGA